MTIRLRLHIITNVYAKLDAHHFGPLIRTGWYISSYRYIAQHLLLIEIYELLAF